MGALELERHSSGHKGNREKEKNSTKKTLYMKGGQMKESTDLVIKGSLTPSSKGPHESALVSKPTIGWKISSSKKNLMAINDRAGNDRDKETPFVQIWLMCLCLLKVN